MPLPALTLAVVGADYPNKRGPSRRFELQICQPGEPVELRPEPNNPADPRAIAVYSCRGIQIGYLTAERAGRIGQLIHQGLEIIAIFQEHARFGAYIRVSFDGETPTLPESREDRDLELEFRRIASNQSQWGWKRIDFSKVQFEPIFAPKAANLAGHQLTDLVARPLALHALRPDQPNRAFDVIRPKIKGLKTFP